MSDREKLENLRAMLDELINTCESEISIANKMLSKTRDIKEISKLQKEKAFWQGKLEVAKYLRYFAD